MCPHTTIYVSSELTAALSNHRGLLLYIYICVLILLYLCPQSWRPHFLITKVYSYTSTYASSYYHIYVIALLYMCPHATAIYVSTDSGILSLQSWDTSTLLSQKKQKKTLLSYIRVLTLLLFLKKAQNLSFQKKKLVLWGYLDSCPCSVSRRILLL